MGRRRAARLIDPSPEQSVATIGQVVVAKRRSWVAAEPRMGVEHWVMLRERTTATDDLMKPQA